MPEKPRDMDAYLASLSASDRGALEKIRKTIHAMLPRVEECFSYGIPAFKIKGKLLAGFSAWKHFCSYYPMSGGVIKTLETDLAAYETTKGCIHFTRANPLPVHLVRKLLKARMAELED